MDCDAVRGRLMERGADAETVSHVRGCCACARFERRLGLAREVLRSGADVDPEPGFAHRVTAGLPRPVDTLGWAALRALPAAVALALVLVYLGLSQPLPPASLLAGESEPDLVLTWAALAPEEAP